MNVFKTTDNYEVDIRTFNSFDGSSYVFIANEPGRWVNSTDKWYCLDGLDTLAVLKSDGPHMTKAEIEHIFFGK